MLLHFNSNDISGPLSFPKARNLTGEMPESFNTHIFLLTVALCQKSKREGKC